jgi:hypothetical protein
MRTIKVLAICGALSILALASCSSIPRVLYGKRIAGQVVDADTGQPLPGVHVAYVWESGVIPRGFTGHNSQTICYHAAAAVTDATGHFQIDPWREWSTYRVLVADPIALVYARDYQPRQITLLQGPIEPPIERLNERYALTRFSGTVSERLEAMWGGIANRGCMYGKESQKSLFPMLKAMYEEARDLSRGEADARRIEGFAWIAARVALAYDPNGPGHDTEIDQFIKERLQ